MKFIQDFLRRLAILKRSNFLRSRLNPLRGLSLVYISSWGLTHLLLGKFSLPLPFPDNHFDDIVFRQKSGVRLNGSTPKRHLDEKFPATKTKAKPPKIKFASKTIIQHTVFNQSHPSAFVTLHRSILIENTPINLKKKSEKFTRGNFSSGRSLHPSAAFHGKMQTEI